MRQRRRRRFGQKSNKLSNKLIHLVSHGERGYFNVQLSPSDQRRALLAKTQAKKDNCLVLERPRHKVYIIIRSLFFVSSAPYFFKHPFSPFHWTDWKNSQFYEAAISAHAPFSPLKYTFNITAHSECGECRRYRDLICVMPFGFTPTERPGPHIQRPWIHFSLRQHWP